MYSTATVAELSLADVLEPEAETTGVRVAADGSDDETGELHVARAAGELAGRERRVSTTGDRRVQEEHREHRPRPTAR